ncbi:NrsF family protein [Caulobacter sp. UC70_42]|uniref:NrsF family protein n=1 Tax=Caulobacter sp. UC70_42 TaxID=3374551 RepID=UPI0037570C08
MTIDDTVAPIGGVGGGAPIWSAATLPWRLAEAAAAGALAGVLMILVWLDLRPDLPLAATQTFFWIKAVYPAAVALCALAAATLLARARRGGFRAMAGAGALACAMLIAAAVQASGADAEALTAPDWPSAAACLGDILVIAAPMLALVAAGLRDVDLERPAPTGFACGLFCGGVAATVDGLHCWQGTYTFVGLWFTLAMLLSGAVGAGAVKLLARRRRFLAAAE